MSKTSLKPVIRHLIAIIIFAATALIYFYPASFQGKVLGNQTDRIQAEARQHEAKTFNKELDRSVLWTNSIFSGMPSILVTGHDVSTFNYLTLGTLNLFRFFSKSTTPYALFFGGFLGMYFLLTVVKLDWRLSILGALAFGLNTSNILLIEGGHFNKLQNIILCPPLLASIIILFRGKLWLGSALVALFGSVVLLSAHIQIAFYFTFFIVTYLIILLAEAVKAGEVKEYTKKFAVLVAASLLALMPGAYKTWALYQYGQESNRGKTELVKENEPQDGITKDYAFRWSMGKMETFGVLVPNIKGETSREAFVNDRESASFKALRGNPNANQLAQFTRKYFGDQPFVGGAYYYGALLIFLFFLSMVGLKGPWRTWAIVCMVLTCMIGWGRNLEWFNFFLFDHFPLFNKFRAVNMMFNLGHIPLILFGLMGLQNLLKEPKRWSSKTVLIGGGITVGLAVLALIYSWTGDLSGPNDQLLKGQERFLDALWKDRAAAIQGDAWRAVLFILVGIGLIWAWIKGKIKSGLLIFALGLFIMIDVISVNLRYLNADNFVKKQNFNALFQPRAVDNQILQDNDLHYRVFDLSSGDPFNNNLSAYHHRLVNGYHPTKVKIYQELIETYLSRYNEYPHILDMLNTKYIIQGNQQSPQVSRNPNALGNAWFVENVRVVNNANEAMDGLANLNPKQEAIIQEKYLKNVESLSFGPVGSSSIRLTNYIPDHLTYDYSSDKDRLLVFSEVYYPESKGWKVYIDGQRKEGVMKTNYVLNSIMVPAGNHKLELIFEPDNFDTFIWISRIGSLMLIILLGYSLFLLNKRGNLVEEVGAEIYEFDKTPKPKKLSKTKRKK